MSPAPPPPEATPQAGKTERCAYVFSDGVCGHMAAQHYVLVGGGCCSVCTCPGYVAPPAPSPDKQAEARCATCGGPIYPIEGTDAAICPRCAAPSGGTLASMADIDYPLRPAPPATSSAGVLDPQTFDDNLNLCYHAGYHDGAFPQEPSYSERFEATRGTLIAHDAALREEVERLKGARLSLCVARGERDKAEARVATLEAILKRFLTEGSGLGASHPHFAAYVAFPAELWTDARRALKEPR